MNKSLIAIAGLAAMSMAYRSAEPGVDGTGGATAAPPPLPGKTPEMLAAEAAAKAEDIAKKAADKKAKADAAAALKAETKAKKDAEKAEAKAKAEADKVAKKDAAEAGKQAKKDEIAAKAQAKVDAKAAREAAKAANQMPEQNGVRRPKPETLCGKAWAVFDSLSSTKGTPVTIQESLAVTTPQGLVEGNVKAEYARWRKFFGITGRLAAPAAPAAPALPEGTAAPAA